jgi:arylsulfatase
MKKTVLLVIVTLVVGAVAGALVVFFFVPIDVSKLERKGPPKLGDPQFTEVLHSKVLPPLPMKFGGEIKDTYAESKPWWPPTIVPPKSAPNILLIMLDDAGYGSASTFGGTIPTPAFDRVAKAGLRYTMFHLVCAVLP